MTYRVHETSFLNGTNGNDFYVGNDWSDFIAAYDGDDKLYGFGGTDSLYGDAGNDLLNGGSGDDVLWGGTGDDILIGGTGKDVFFFVNGVSPISAGTSIQEGNDIIKDFTPGEDKLDFLFVEGLKSFADVQMRMHEEGSNLVINLNGNLVINSVHDTITLENIKISDLHSSDFII
jgi:hypothetical protein